MHSQSRGAFRTTRQPHALGPVKKTLSVGVYGTAIGFAAAPVRRLPVATGGLSLRCDCGPWGLYIINGCDMLKLFSAHVRTPVLPTQGRPASSSASNPLQLPWVRPYCGGLICSHERGSKSSVPLRGVSAVRVWQPQSFNVQCHADRRSVPLVTPHLWVQLSIHLSIGIRMPLLYSVSVSQVSLSSYGTIC